MLSGLSGIPMVRHIIELANTSHVDLDAGSPDNVRANKRGFRAHVRLVELFVDSAEETRDKIIAVNLCGTITVTRAVLDEMIERGRGRIIHIASDSVRH